MMPLHTFGEENTSQSVVKKSKSIEKCKEEALANMKNNRKIICSCVWTDGTDAAILNCTEVPTHSEDSEEEEDEVEWPWWGTLAAIVGGVVVGWQVLCVEDCNYCLWKK